MGSGILPNKKRNNRAKDDSSSEFARDLLNIMSLGVWVRSPGVGAIVPNGQISETVVNGLRVLDSPSASHSGHALLDVFFKFRILGSLNLIARILFNGYFLQKLWREKKLAQKKRKTFRYISDIGLSIPSFILFCIFGMNPYTAGLMLVNVSVDLCCHVSRLFKTNKIKNTPISRLKKNQYQDPRYLRLKFLKHGTRLVFSAGVMALTAVWCFIPAATIPAAVGLVALALLRLVIERGLTRRRALLKNDILINQTEFFEPKGDGDMAQKKALSHNHSMTMMCRELDISREQVAATPEPTQSQGDIANTVPRSANDKNTERGLLAHEQTFEFESPRLVPIMGSKAKRLAEELRPKLTMPRRSELKPA